jgi:hypothetical protein
VNGFGPAHIEKSHFKGIFGCIFRLSFEKIKITKNVPVQVIFTGKNQ